jgi:hypothetical protein
MTPENTSDTGGLGRRDHCESHLRFPRRLCWAEVKDTVDAVDGAGETVRLGEITNSHFVGTVTAGDFSSSPIAHQRAHHHPTFGHLMQHQLAVAPRRAHHQDTHRCPHA